MYATLDELKKYLKIDLNDTEDDELLSLLISSTSSDIDVETQYMFQEGNEIPQNIKMACLVLSAIQYRMIGSENLKSESIGPLSSTYSYEIPIYISKILNNYRGKII